MKKPLETISRPSIVIAYQKLGEGITCAEIGVDKGKNAFEIYHYLLPKMLYLIDPYNNFIDIDSGEIIGEAQYLMAKERLKNCPDIEFIKDISSNAVKRFKDNELDFVYIDASHSFNDIWRDINLWYPKVKIGGILAGHDYCDEHWQIQKAVNLFCQQHRLDFQSGGQDWWIVAK